MIFRLYAIFSTVIICASSAIAQERFAFAEAAVQALIDAAQSHNAVRLATIFGPNAGDMLVSGNPTQDRSEQEEFARLARTRHRLEISSINPNRAVLAIGDEDWPFPVPLRRADGKWSFDALETPIEMRARKIGSDELDAIEICHGYVEAQMKYASEDRDGDGMLEYALHLMSRPSQHDGLYANDESELLIPPGLAHAEWQGVQKRDAKPYHGYYFRVLDGQDSSALGGAHNYLVKGKMIGGFGLAAWPAEYGVTGIHTFIVNQRDIVYQKAIAPIPGKAPVVITHFTPDTSWEPAE